MLITDFWPQRRALCYRLSSLRASGQGPPVLAPSLIRPVATDSGKQGLLTSCGRELRSKQLPAQEQSGKVSSSQGSAPGLVSSTSGHKTQGSGLASSKSHGTESGRPRMAIVRTPDHHNHNKAVTAWVSVAQAATPASGKEVCVSARLPPPWRASRLSSRKLRFWNPGTPAGA